MEGRCPTRWPTRSRTRRAGGRRRGCSRNDRHVGRVTLGLRTDLAGVLHEMRGVQLAESLEIGRRAGQPDTFRWGPAGRKAALSSQGGEVALPGLRPIVPEAL